MIVTRVILQNYGVYRDKNEFDFTCTQQKPIILVGGTNGAGKTTLFESIMLCLYGISTMAKRSTKKSYEQFLERKIHRYSKSNIIADHASIIVQFKFFHNNREVEYSVERSWQKEEGKIIEQLNVKKRDSDDAKFISLGTVEKSYWQSFIEDLIPRGIVKLFFFDGEKIVEIAREGAEDVVIKEAFKTLLGIELVEQLRTDLQVNVTHNLTGNSKALREDFEEYKAKKDEGVNIVKNLQEKLSKKQTEIDSLEMEIEVTEGHISKIGGEFSSGREDAKTNLATQKTVYDNIHQKIEELCSDALPFSIIPGHLENLTKQIESDESILQQQMGQKLLHSSNNKIKSEIEKSAFWDDTKLSLNDIKTATSALSKLLDSELGKDLPTGKPVLGLSAVQISKIIETSRNANADTLQSLKKYTQQIVIVDDNMTHLKSSIANAANDDEIGILVTKIGKLNSETGMLRAEMNHIEEKISSHTSMKRHLDSKLRNIISKIYENEKSQQHVELTQNIQKVLDEFIDKLKVKKIRLLEEYLLDAVNILMHKRHLIEDVKIDSETFEITLFGQDKKILPKDLLSEGEKQMFAMSVLWALAKTSGRPLPFIIDTPLARLDEEHRTNIIEKFFPRASHQIMIFSTDKEIEHNDYQKLEPYLARSYAMEYLEDKGSTKKHNGYFWNTQGERIVTI